MAVALAEAGAEIILVQVRYECVVFLRSNANHNLYYSETSPTPKPAMRSALYLENAQYSPAIYRHSPPFPLSSRMSSRAIHVSPSS